MARDEIDPADMDGRGRYAPRHFTTTLIGVDVEEAVEHRYQTLDRVIAYFAGVEAECGVALKHQAGCVFKSLMQDLNTLMSGGQARRDMLGSMEPRGGSETELMQMSTLVAVFVLPGLASLMLRKKDEHDPQFLVRQLKPEGGLGDVVCRHGRAAAILDYFVLPLMARHPRRIVEKGRQYKAATVQALEVMAKKRKLSKSLKNAVQRLEAEKTPGTGRRRHTKVEVEDLIDDKLPTRISREVLGHGGDLPMGDALPTMDYFTGQIDWGGAQIQESKVDVLASMVLRVL